MEREKETKLGILYPPTGSEFEYYTAVAPLRPPVRTCLVGVRIVGGALEHQPRFLRQTARLDNLRLSARSLRPVGVDSAMWACTSGSFINGLDFAKEQAAAIADEIEAPCSSTSLAFTEALEHLGIERTAMVSSYPRTTFQAFEGLLDEAGFEVGDRVTLNALSGPQAAAIGDQRLIEAALRLNLPKDGALLIPDTAMPTMDLIRALEKRLDRTVLTANQVTLWQGLRLAGVTPNLPRLGRLFAGLA